MLKLSFIEAIGQRLPVKLHPKTLELYIGRAYNQIIYDTFRKDLTSMDIFTKTYKDVTVAYDTDVEVYYSTLPVQIIQLPISGDGVLSIHTMTGKGIEFAAKKAGMQNIHSNMEVAALDGPIGYWLMDGRVEYEETGDIATTNTVRMRIIPQFGELGMLEEIHIPSGKDEQLMELITQFAIGAPPQKETNDQSDKTL